LHLQGIKISFEGKHGAAIYGGATQLMMVTTALRRKGDGRNGVKVQADHRQKMEGKQMVIRETAARRIMGRSECLPDYTAAHQTISWPIQQAANQTSPATSHITNLTHNQL
jgi:hypothetical protein